jgi:predicted transcriptional regulator
MLIVFNSNERSYFKLLRLKSNKVMFEVAKRITFEESIVYTKLSNLWGHLDII